MTLLQSPTALNTWTPIAWDDFAQLIEQPEHQNHKAYYYNGRMRIEAMLTGLDHSDTHALLMSLVSLFCIVRGIPIRSRDACSYRHPNFTEFQPDASYYIGDNANCIPKGTRIVNLEQYPKPDLVIEVSDTTLSDDKGEKRLQYEELRIFEYWILDVQILKIIAFKINSNFGSDRIRTSKVLSGFSLDLAEEALARSVSLNHTAAGAWFMEQLAK